ncbi:TPA: hypothetical protein OUJ94_000427 [Proteus mirabilis]|nr:hypothetical protein [Proteus mirabilis]
MKMNKLITTAVATLFLSGCDTIVDKPRVWHDDKRFVTCYMSPTMESIYCIPDNQLPNYSKDNKND